MQPSVQDTVRLLRSWANMGAQEAIKSYRTRTGNEEIDGMIHESFLFVKHVNVVINREAPTKAFRVKKVIVATGQKESGTYLEVTTYFRFGESADDAVVPVTLEYPIDQPALIH